MYYCQGNLWFCMIFFLRQFSSKSFNSNMTFQNFWKTPHDNAMHPLLCCVICKSVVTGIISACDIFKVSCLFWRHLPVWRQRDQPKPWPRRLAADWILGSNCWRQQHEQLENLQRFLSESVSAQASAIESGKWTLMFVLYIMRAHLTGLPQGSNADDTFRIHWDLTITGTLTVTSRWLAV